VTDQELFYRNVMIDYDEREEAVVKVSKGYGIVVEVILEGGTVETTLRLSAAGALGLGKALCDAGDVATRSRSEDGETL